MAVGIGDLAVHVTGKAEAELDPGQRAALVDLHHTRLSRRPADGGMLDARFRRDAPIGPLRGSGALSLLSPWKVRGVGVPS